MVVEYLVMQKMYEEELICLVGISWFCDWLVCVGYRRHILSCLCWLLATDFWSVGYWQQTFGLCWLWAADFWSVWVGYWQQTFGLFVLVAGNSHLVCLC